MADIRKFIYFPNDFHNKKPVLIYVTDKWGNEWKGGTVMSDVEEGKTQYYPMTRCQPYSDALWTACMQWLARRDLLESEYRELMKRGVRPNG